MRTLAKSRSSSQSRLHNERSSSSGAKVKEIPHQAAPGHQVRRPPSNTSGNIAPLERVRSPTRENTNYNQTSLDSIEKESELDAMQEEEAATSSIAIETLNHPPTLQGTHLGSLTALPLQMLSPALSKNIFSDLDTTLESTEDGNGQENILPAVEVILSSSYRQKKQRELQQQQQKEEIVAWPTSGTPQIAEFVFGRLALCGLLGTSFVTLFTGETLSQQIMTYPDNILLISLAVLSASLKLRKSGDGEKSRTSLQVQYLPGFFSVGVERWMGRIAMASFGSLLTWQFLSSFI